MRVFRYRTYALLNLIRISIQKESLSDSFFSTFANFILQTSFQMNPIRTIFEDKFRYMVHIDNDLPIYSCKIILFKKYVNPISFPDLVTNMEKRYV